MTHFPSALLLPLLLVSSPALLARPAAIPAESVVVLYNSREADSKSLARHYARVRAIPEDNLVGLPMPPDEEISREQFDEKIRDPLRKLFEARGWWEQTEGADGLTQPISLKRRILVTMRGVPYKIARTPETIPANQLEKRPFAPDPKGNESSIDSELSLLGVEGYSTAGQINNPYFRQDESVMDFSNASFLVVGRIDGPSLAICKRMIDDARAVEESGLWGMAYLDLARKGEGYELGDQWLEKIAGMNREAGIPTVIDRHPDTYVTNYPMSHAALYYGWYSHHRSGPLLNEGFRFKRGAVAIHLHSYSAFELRHPARRWCGPILAHGAAATVGNVYEPFLALTHHFDIIHQRLLQGYTIGEASHMALPALSWQAVLLGDPLYRPFREDLKVNVKDREDRDYKALRHARIEWGDDPEKLVPKLRTYANNTNSGPVFEALGLLARANQQEEQATAFFTSASDKFQNKTDQLRQDLHIMDVYRAAGNKETAILLLRKMKKRYSRLPEGKAVISLLNILDPPSPPPVKVEPKKRRRNR